MASAGSLHSQVDVEYDKETRKVIEAGEYRPAPNDQVLDPMDVISDVWERPPDRCLTFSSVYLYRVQWAARFWIRWPVRAPYPYPHVSTTHTCILFTHICISEHIFAKRHGLNIIRKPQEIRLYRGIVFALIILDTL